ncbi:MAG: glutamate racemase [Spirochaetales bacterium]|nr:glutamate racemase [Spirochaetales bacterium]
MANKQKPILIFDSGVGGLPYLERARMKLPNERFAYLADTRHFPYGEKSEDQIKKAVIDAVAAAIALIDPKCAVVACNTASVVALGELRKRFSIPFIGVVPAVKPAAFTSQKRTIGVLATQQTVNNPYLHNLIKEFASGCDVAIVPAGRVTELVEYEFFTAAEDEKLDVLQAVVKDILKRGIDSVVLACTHFLLLEKEFKSVLGDRVTLIDSREGVANQLVRVLDASGLRSEKRDGEDAFYHTGGPDKDEAGEQYFLFAKAYELVFAGALRMDY